MLGNVYVIFPDGHMVQATVGTTFPYANGYAVKTMFDSMALLQTPLQAPNGPLVRLPAGPSP